VEELESRFTPAVTVRFDYSLDTSGFFNDPVRRADLEAVAASIAPRLHDDLAAITPGGPNSWTATLYNPITSQSLSLKNPTIAADEIVVYVGATRLGGGELGLATTGGFSAAGTRSWLDTVRSRGQAGSGQTDYATWGGMITFDSATNWHFGPSAPPANRYDFRSVATHELLHVFGFGLGQPSFARHVSGWDGSTGSFNGPTAAALYGRPIPVVGHHDQGPDHFAPGVSYNGQPSPTQPVMPQGVRRLVTDLELAVLQDVGWEVFVDPAPAPTVAQATHSSALTAERSAEPAGGPVFASGPIDHSDITAEPITLPAGVTDQRFVVGTSDGIAVLDPNGRAVLTARPFDPGAGGFRVALADLTGDGVPETVAGSGPGVSNRVTVADGQSGQIIADFQPFEGSFGGGVFLTAGDLSGDGRPDVVVTADAGGGPVVAVFDGAQLAQGRAVQIARLLGIEDPDFRGGARPAVGDVNGDGAADLIVSAGTGGGPRVAVWDGASIRAGRPTKAAADFFAFEPSVRNGTYVTAADLNGDGFAELLTGAGPGGAPRLVAFDGAQLAAGRRVALADFFTGSPSDRGGVRVATADLEGDGRPDVVIGSGAGATSVSVYRGRDVAAGVGLPALSLKVSGDAGAGVFVG
jgi:hypothetical protein